MSELINDIQHDVGAQATKKARKAKKPVAAAKPSKNGMSPQRASVLKVLVKAGGGTLESLTTKSKLPERAAYHHLWHLRKDGLVKSSNNPELNELIFELTAKGRKVGAKA